MLGDVSCRGRQIKRKKKGKKGDTDMACSGREKIDNPLAERGVLFFWERLNDFLFFFVFEKWWFCYSRTHTHFFF